MLTVDAEISVEGINELLEGDRTPPSPKTRSRLLILLA